MAFNRENLKKAHDEFKNSADITTLIKLATQLDQIDQITKEDKSALAAITPADSKLYSQCFASIRTALQTNVDLRSAYVYRHQYHNISDSTKKFINREMAVVSLLSIQSDANDRYNDLIDPSFLASDDPLNRLEEYLTALTKLHKQFEIAKSAPLLEEYKDNAYEASIRHLIQAVSYLNLVEPRNTTQKERDLNNKQNKLIKSITRTLNNISNTPGVIAVYEFLIREKKYLSPETKSRLAKLILNSTCLQALKKHILDHNAGSVLFDNRLHQLFEFITQDDKEQAKQNIKAQDPTDFVLLEARLEKKINTSPFRELKALISERQTVLYRYNKEIAPALDIKKLREKAEALKLLKPNDNSDLSAIIQREIDTTHALATEKERARIDALVGHALMNETKAFLASLSQEGKDEKDFTAALDNFKTSILKTKELSERKDISEEGRKLIKQLFCIVKDTILNDFFNKRNLSNNMAQAFIPTLQFLQKLDPSSSQKLIKKLEQSYREHIIEPRCYIKIINELIKNSIINENDSPLTFIYFELQIALNNYQEDCDQSNLIILHQKTEIAKTILASQRDQKSLTQEMISPENLKKFIDYNLEKIDSSLLLKYKELLDKSIIDDVKAEIKRFVDPEQETDSPHSNLSEANAHLSKAIGYLIHLKQDVVTAMEFIKAVGGPNEIAVLLSEPDIGIAIANLLIKDPTFLIQMEKKYIEQSVNVLLAESKKASSPSSPKDLYDIFKTNQHKNLAAALLKNPIFIQWALQPENLPALKDLINRLDDKLFLEVYHHAPTLIGGGRLDQRTYVQFHQTLLEMGKPSLLFPEITEYETFEGVINTHIHRITPNFQYWTDGDFKQAKTKPYGSYTTWAALTLNNNDELKLHNDTIRDFIRYLDPTVLTPDQIASLSKAARIAWFNYLGRSQGQIPSPWSYLKAKLNPNEKALALIHDFTKDDFSHLEKGKAHLLLLLPHKDMPQEIVGYLREQKQDDVVDIALTALQELDLGYWRIPIDKDGNRKIPDVFYKLKDNVVLDGVIAFFTGRGDGSAYTNAIFDLCQMSLPHLPDHYEFKEDHYQLASNKLIKFSVQQRWYPFLNDTLAHFTAKKGYDLAVAAALKYVNNTTSIITPEGLFQPHLVADEKTGKGHYEYKKLITKEELNELGLGVYLEEAKGTAYSPKKLTSDQLNKLNLKIKEKGGVLCKTPTSQIAAPIPTAFKLVFGRPELFANNQTLHIDRIIQGAITASSVGAISPALFLTTIERCQEVLNKWLNQAGHKPKPVSVTSNDIPDFLLNNAHFDPDDIKALLTIMHRYRHPENVPNLERNGHPDTHALLGPLYFSDKTSLNKFLEKEKDYGKKTVGDQVMNAALVVINATSLTGGMFSVIGIPHWLRSAIPAAHSGAFVGIAAAFIAHAFGIGTGGLGYLLLIGAAAGLLVSTLLAVAVDVAIWTPIKNWYSQAMGIDADNKKEFMTLKDGLSFLNSDDPLKNHNYFQEDNPEGIKTVDDFIAVLRTNPTTRENFARMYLKMHDLGKLQDSDFIPAGVRDYIEPYAALIDRERYRENGFWRTVYTWLMWPYYFHMERKIENMEKAAVADTPHTPSSTAGVRLSLAVPPEVKLAPSTAPASSSAQNSQSAHNNTELMGVESKTGEHALKTTSTSPRPGHSSSQ